MTTLRRFLDHARRIANNPSRFAYLHHYGGLSESQSRLRVVTLLGVAGLIILNGADVVTTHILMARGAVEANPLSSVLLANASLLWVKLAILGALGILVIGTTPGLV